MPLRHTPVALAWACLALVGTLSGCGAGTGRPLPGYGGDDDAAITSCDDPRFSVSVLPAFQLRCRQCHRSNAALGGLSLEDHAAVLQGGQSGPAVVPGDCAGSLLYQLVGGQGQPAMPPTGYERVPDEDIACICAWIEEGALDD